MTQVMLDRLFTAMAEYDRGDTKRIMHFLKVHELARHIALGEGVLEETRLLIEAGALVHDIGIKNCEKKYGKCPGPLQEKEGPPEAEKMLRALGFSPNETQRICELVAHHHTYESIDSAELQILVEADFLVNLHEDGCSRAAVQNAHDKYFKTATGRRLCETLYGLESKA